MNKTLLASVFLLGVLMGLVASMLSGVRRPAHGEQAASLARTEARHPAVGGRGTESRRPEAAPPADELLATTESAGPSTDRGLTDPSPARMQRPRADERDLLAPSESARAPTPESASPVDPANAPPRALSAHERIARLMVNRPRLSNSSGVQAAGYRMPYGPVIEYGMRTNAPSEVGLRAVALAARFGFPENEEAKQSLTDRAFDLEMRRLEFVRRVFDERQRAVDALKASGGGTRDYVAYHIENDALYVIPSGSFPALDAAVHDLAQFERSVEATLVDEAKRFVR